MEEKQEMSFETAIARLEEIVRMLESGNAPLDKALAAFEEGSVPRKALQFSSRYGRTEGKNTHSRGERKSRRDGYG